MVRTLMTVCRMARVIKVRGSQDKEIRPRTRS